MLRAGGLVAIPTETVYGLAADASNPDAVRRIFAVKGRPADHPLIVHLAAPSTRRLGGRRSRRRPRVLADACWPGPLTLLVPRAAHVLDVVTGGRSTVGLRVPAHPLTLELLARFGGGLAAPSANRFGKVSPTTADHVRADLGDDVDYVLDGGPCPVGVESDDRRLHRGAAPGAATRWHTDRADRCAAERRARRGGRTEPGAGDAGIPLRPEMPSAVGHQSGRGPTTGSRPIRPRRSSTTMTSPATPARCTAGCATPTTVGSTR